MRTWLILITALTLPLFLFFKAFQFLQTTTSIFPAQPPIDPQFLSQALEILYKKSYGEAHFLSRAIDPQLFRATQSEIRKSRAQEIQATITKFQGFSTNKENSIKTTYIEALGEIHTTTKIPNGEVLKGSLAPKPIQEEITREIKNRIREKILPNETPLKSAIPFTLSNPNRPTTNIDIDTNTLTSWFETWLIRSTSPRPLAALTIHFLRKSPSERPEWKIRHIDKNPILTPNGEPLPIIKTSYPVQWAFQLQEKKGQRPTLKQVEKFPQRNPSPSRSKPTLKPWPNTSTPPLDTPNVSQSPNPEKSPKPWAF